MTTAKKKPMKPAPARTSKAAKPARKVAPVAPRYSEQYQSALKEYERGIALIQKRDFAGAADVFTSVIATFEDEREISDRARHYLAICQEKLHPKIPSPASVADHFHLGVYHLNRADWESALKEFE